MKIAVTGGTGFIGSHLIRYLLEKGHEPVLISRSGHRSSSGGVSRLTWSELRKEPGRLEGVEAIVNLSGATINRRWTEAGKRLILESRLETTAAVAELVAKLERKPNVVINGSGMSVYGSSLNERFTETSPHRMTDYLAEVVEKWEAAADHIEGTRVVKLRVGLVLGSDGGALPKMMLPYRLFAGGRVGGGRQWVSWIHIDDIVRLIEFCIENETMEGPVNATAPSPVRNDEFGKMLGSVLGRPHWMPVPALMLKLLFGEMSVLLLEGQQVIPQKALDQGFEFRYPVLKPALQAIVRE